MSDKQNTGTKTIQIEWTEDDELMIDVIDFALKQLERCKDFQNKPVTVDGWKIYQYGYDTQMGAMSQTSILELVRDPWLPAVYTGIYMMLAGAVCMCVLGRGTRV